MSAPRPAAEPSIDVTAASIASFFGAGGILAALTLVACLRVNGWL